ncbi:hypothetical protein QQS21_005716 [Conoideocrella luteorostrata]|uniref:BHLH domain-containing protein n=1 Tax=Conoideocrella luteorostrata TaxID=1105319 RepID=A0AAJ0CNY3_9HYPO|nr:hypothetical protein QQS21_005716 [Conoideocrella luteorostrata]
MEAHYYLDAPLHRAVDHINCLGPDPEQLPGYEAMLYAQDIDFRPARRASIELPPLNDAISFGVASSELPLNCFQTALERQARLRPQSTTECQGRMHPHGMTQSRETKQVGHPYYIHDAATANYLASAGDASAQNEGTRRVEGAKTGFHFQSFDSFRHDIVRSSEVIEIGATPPKWCWGIDTTTTASLMQSIHIERLYPHFPMNNCHDKIPCRRRDDTRKSELHMHEPLLEQVHRHDSLIPQSIYDAPSESSQITFHAPLTVAFVRPRRVKQSVEQRRSNHIQQEQERRIKVKNGLCNLASIIPGLGKRDMSKSVILEKTAEWLEAFVRGNKFLREQLSLLETVNRQARRLKRAEAELRYF